MKSPDFCVERTEKGLVAVAFIPADLDWLDGHFDGNPVVPGVAILSWIMELASDSFGTRNGGFCLDTAKFVAPVFPGDRFSIEIDMTKPGCILFVAKTQDRVAAKGAFSLKQGRKS